MVIGGMHIRFLFCALAMALTLFSCKKAEVEEVIVVKRPKTVLLYMVANNNLLRLRLLAGEEGERHSQSAKEKPYVHASYYHILQR